MAESKEKQPGIFLNENAEQQKKTTDFYNRGAEVFGSSSAFMGWMDSTVRALGNKKPKDFLNTREGIEMLMDELGRIEHGIFA